MGNAIDITKYTENTRREDIPVELFGECPAGVIQFADDEKTDGTFSLMLYDGKVHYHWYWGNLAFDLEGMEMLKSDGNPILWDHDWNVAIGVSTSASFDGKFILEGTFLESSEKAAEIRSNSKQKLKYESSLSVDSSNAIIEHVKDGASAKVNGFTLKGPGTIFRKCKIREGSIVMFGALKNCKSKIFKQNVIPERKIVMDLETLQTDHADTFAEVKDLGHTEGLAAGEKKQIELFKHVLELAGDNDLAVECIKSGKTSDADVLNAKAEKLQKENVNLTQELKDVKAGKANLSENTDDPAENEFKNLEDDKLENAASGKNGENLTEDLTEDQLKENYKKSKKLQDQFTSEKAYLAYVKHAKKGSIKVFGKDL